MDKSVYEVLGWYVDSISKSLYLGTAEGRVYVNGREMFRGNARVSLFSEGSRIEAGTVWGAEDKKGVPR